MRLNTLELDNQVPESDFKGAMIARGVLRGASKDNVFETTVNSEGAPCKVWNEIQNICY